MLTVFFKDAAFLQLPLPVGCRSALVAAVVHVDIAVAGVHVLGAEH